MTVLFFKAVQLDLFDEPVHVGGHTRRDGAYVAPHMSRRRKRHDAPNGHIPRLPPESKAAEAAQEVDTAPSEAQKQAGNYRKGRVSIQGIDIAIENPKGSTRSGTGPGGERWERELAHHYGYIKRSEGADGDAVDVFIGPHEDADTVYVIDQLDQSGSFDEHKVMLGFADMEAAKAGYLANYEAGWQGMGTVTTMSVPGFKRWLAHSDTTDPAAASDAGTFQATHELADGTRVRAAGDEHGLWVDAAGDEIEDDHAIAIRQEGAVADPLAFGVAAGTGKAERRRINAAVVDRLRLGGEYTEADKALLRQYSGRGGCGDSLNEYYTPADVAAGIWAALANIGMPDNAKVWEPSCGTGVFLHTAPAGAKVTGVEMDNISAKVAGILHSGHEVHERACEDFATTDVRQFDAVVGNPPFGLRGALLAADKKQRKRAEAYFLDAAIDKTKPGGLVAMVLPAGVMDGSNNRAFRAELLTKAEFLGARRMPNSAFATSHTDVTTDVVFFRRRDPSAAAALKVGGETLLRRHGIWDDEFVGGSYFAGRGIDHVYGTPEPGWRSKAGMGEDFTVAGSMQGVADAIAGFTPEERANPTAADLMADMDDAERAQVARAAAKPAYEYAEVGDTKTVDGALYRLEGEPPRWHRVDADAAPDPALADAEAIAADLDRLFAGGEVDRDDLIGSLDAFVAEHGAPAKYAAIRVAARDNKALHRLIAAVRADGSYSDLVTGHKAARGEQSLEAAAEALIAQQAEFTAAELALAWGGGDADTVAEHLYANTRFALAADGATWSGAEDYLSGDLWAKADALDAVLADADALAANLAKWQHQRKALEAAIDPKLLEDVEVTVNAGWIPPSVLAAWFNVEVDAYKQKHPTSQWAPEPMTIDYADGVYTIKGGMHSAGLLAKHLNRTGVRADDRPIIEKWDREFKAWLCASEYRPEIEEAYNRSFRGFAAKRYSDAPMAVPGLRDDADINAYHWEGVRWALGQGKGIIAADVGLGKAQPLDAKVLTPTGWRAMGELVKGDHVIASDGSATEVTGVFPQGEKEIFKVEFSDGAVTECCDEHLWLTQTALERVNEHQRRADGGIPKVRQLSEIRDSLRYRHQKNHSIPMAGQVEFAPQGVPLNPYLLGVLLGDGALKHRTPSFTNPVIEIAEAVALRLPDGYILSPFRDTEKCPGYYLVRASKAQPRNAIADTLQALGLNVGSCEKFVPAQYLINSQEVRLQMLQGLMDTDGYVDQQGVTVQFNSSSRQLALDVQFIAMSLGANATIKSKIPSYTHQGERRQGKRHYTVHLRLPPSVEPFAYCAAKRERVRPKSKYQPRRFITAVTPVGRKPAQCIQVAHASHLYVTDDFIVTHNTVRALMIARLLHIHGNAEKPAIVVPKSVLANWYAEIENWFPGANVMVVGETYARDKAGNLKAKTDDKATRDRKLHEISQNAYDFVLISEPVWAEIDLDPITKGEYHRRDFWVQRAEQLDQVGDKRANNIRQAHDQALANREFSKRTDSIYCNDLGIDALLIDEFHHAKNLFAARSRYGKQPKFLGGTGLSNRALDTNLKARWLLDQNNGKNVFGLTATPTKNSPLEIYSMLHHVAPEAFAALGIKNSEDFIDRYCEFTTEAIIGTNGKVQDSLVTAGFKNLGELRHVMSRYIDRTTAEDVGLVLPDPEHIEHLIDMSAEQKAVYAELREDAETAGSEKSGDAHIFSVMDKMAKAALDLHLYDGRESKSPKYAAAAKQIIAGVKDGGQVAFADHIVAHDRLKAALVAGGMAEGEIAIVNAKKAASSAARQAISDQFNAGKIKVVIGNTATMGEGINLQKNTSDIHHLDIPWDPASMQQRNGRGLRQGNAQDRVRIHSYLAKGSFDGYRYQTMTAKRDWMDQIWHGGDRVENLARAGALSKDDMLVMLSADPDAARKALQDNKAEIAKRAEAAGHEQAGQAFARFQEMRRSHGALKDKNTATAQRLAARIDVARERLAGNPHFAAKDALTGDHKLLVQPQTGHIFRSNSGFTLAPGPGGPLHYSDKPARFVVTGVDLDTHRVEARPWGQPDGRKYHLALVKMASHVEPFDYDAGAERVAVLGKSLDAGVRDVVRLVRPAEGGQAMRQTMTNAIADTLGNAGDNWRYSDHKRAAVKAGIRRAVVDATGHSDRAREGADALYRQSLLSSAGIAADSRDFIKQLHKLPDGCLHDLAHDLHEHIESGIRACKLDWSLPTPVVDADGKAQLVEYFHAENAFDAGKPFLLPTAENRQKALRGYIDAELGRVWKDEYVQRGRQPTKNIGKRPKYAGFEYSQHAHGNPWRDTGNALFGQGFAAEAEHNLTEHHAFAVAKTQNLEDAVEVARRRDQISHGSQGQAQRSLHPEAVAALFERAAAGGWLDQPWPGEMPGVSGVRPHDNTVRSILVAQPGIDEPLIDRILEHAP